MTGQEKGTPAARSPLAPDRLRRRCDPATLSLPAAVDSAAPAGLVGQARAARALALGLAMPDRGFNVYAAGPPGTGKMASVRSALAEAARGRPRPDDWCYVHNFRAPDRPRVLRLGPGGGRRLRAHLRDLVRAARRELPRAFESEEYVAGREAILGQLNRRREQGFAALAARAQEAGFLLRATPIGIAVVPVVAGRELSDEDVTTLPEGMRAQLARGREVLDGEIRAFLKEVRAAEREARERTEAQDRDVALHAVGGLVDDLVDEYADQPTIVAYLEEVRDGVLADIALFRSHPLAADAALPEPEGGGDPQHLLHERSFRRFDVNVVVDNADTLGAPVVFEANPTLPNLVGRIEREALLGALMTDLTLIGAGALQRANGGYLVLRALDVLRAPLAWDALKRALRERSVAIEDVGEELGLTTARGLRPDPIPLDVKVVLVGEPLHHQLLHALDADFRELFKVRADFAAEMDRTPESEPAYAAALARTEGLRLPLEPAALARLVEESSRLAGDQRKLCACVDQVVDLVREAEHWALADGAAAVGAAQVRRAAEERLYRASLARERLREWIARGVLLVRPSGEAVGQVHGLAVVGLGPDAFGHPVRITATVGVGREGVLDIEREAELGGRVHSKGVLILGGYLSDTYAADKPLALSARLVFEQSYQGVEGDSASLAELLALLSRLAELPLRQGLAVTGSVNQRGEVQAVGGVNEKVEGFFDACGALGPGDEQGVLLPASNAEHLMLRDDVVAGGAGGVFWGRGRSLRRPRGRDGRRGARAGDRPPGRRGPRPGRRAPARAGRDPAPVRRPGGGDPQRPERKPTSGRRDVGGRGGARAGRVVPGAASSDSLLAGLIAPLADIEPALPG
jgi:predicted ATP-dependent protease